MAAAVDPPRRDRGSVVVDRERARPEERVGLLDRGSPTVEPRASGVARRHVARDPDGVVALGVLRRGRPEQGPPRVPVEPVGRVPGRKPSEEKLDELEVLAGAVVTREDEERARSVPGRHRQVGRVLAEGAAHAVEEARVDVQPVRQGSWEPRVQQRPLGQRHLEDVVDPVVEQDLRVERHDHVDPEEELAEALVDMEVDRAGGLVVGPGPVGVTDVALAPDRQHHLERPVAEAVVVDPVGEGDGFLRDVPADDVRHRRAGPVEERVARALERLGPEALADLDDSPLGGAAAADDGHQVAAVRLGRARVVEDHLERRLVEDAAVEDLDRRDPDPLLPDRERVGDLAPGRLPADVHHVTEERGERDPLPLEEDRQDHEPVVAVRDRPLAEVRVVQEDHVAFADLAAEAVDDLGDVGAELADDHLAAGVADHRELVVLHADHGRHGRPPDHLVHLEPRIEERVLDQVERRNVDRRRHVLASSGRISRFSHGSTTARWPGSTTVVASYCSTIA